MTKKPIITYIGVTLVIGIIILNGINIFRKQNTGNANITPGSLVHWGNKKTSEVLWLSDVKKLSAGHDHMLVLTGDGSAYALGSNTFGQLGNRGADYQDEPEKLSFIDNATDISASGHHSLAVDREGNVWSWGLNLSSQLGDGKNEIKATPQKLAGLPKIKNVSAGYRFSVALQEDGRVIAWGASCDATKTMDTQSVINQFASTLMQSGGYGDPGSLSSQAYQFADDCNREKSTGVNTKTPKVIEGLSGIKKIAAGFGHTMALKEDGTIWMLGCNKYGQLGSDGTENALTAQQRKELSNITDISAGYRHSLALTKDGEVWGWGLNGTDQFTVPTKIPSLSNVISIAAGYDYSLALTKNGEVWGWGANATHQFATTDIKNSKTPIKLDMIDNANMIAAGGNHAIATIRE
ncbi:MAG: hypothetical protein M3Q44_07660 [bacterium]|nr:hypothetical protein [bacterium]